MCDPAMRLVQATCVRTSKPTGTIYPANISVTTPAWTAATTTGTNHQRPGAESGELACNGTPTAVGVVVVCPPRKHCALLALLHHPRVRGWWSSGSAAWGPRAVAGFLRHAA